MQYSNIFFVSYIINLNVIADISKGNERETFFFLTALLNQSIVLFNKEHFLNMYNNYVKILLKINENEFSRYNIVDA